MSTIHDIARLAGVSSATVSRALTRPDVVAPATRARIADAARELQYRPANASRRPARIVLILVPHLYGTFFSPFLESASDVLAESGYCVVIGDLKGSGQKEENFAGALRDGRFAGAIFVTGAIPRDGDGEVDLRDGPPIVIASNEIRGRNEFSVFDVDDRTAARKMVSYLIGIGHQRIAHIRGPAGNVEANERYLGYVEAMEAAGLQVEAKLIWEGDFQLNSGAAAAGRYLSAPEMPSAVFAVNDQMAMGFITELRSSGVSVPDDVSVAGFDDTEFSALFTPPLTTMRQPREDLGRLAALDLLRRMSSDDLAPRKVQLECSLVIRGSTQALRKLA